MNKEEVLKLSKLARIEIADSEAETLTHEFEAILGYVSEIKNANLKPETSSNTLAQTNVLREDRDPHKSGKYSEAILNEAPAREGDYIKVKKIL